MLATALMLGLALSADAFASALAQGTSVRGPARATALTVGGAFGLAQGVMPLLGWGLGLAFTAAIAAFDHWVAFAVLSVLGAKLIKEALERGDDEAQPKATGGRTLIALAVATSIDAAAAGLTFEAMSLPPVATAGVIAGVTAVVCAAGVYIGRAMGVALGKPSEALGGCALIFIGLKVLWDHGAIPL